MTTSTFIFKLYLSVYWVHVIYIISHRISEVFSERRLVMMLHVQYSDYFFWSSHRPSVLENSHVLVRRDSIISRRHFGGNVSSYGDPHHLTSVSLNTSVARTSSSSNRNVLTYSQNIKFSECLPSFLFNVCNRNQT